jgi:hypothetical protein
MKIRKYIEFIKEELQDTPENYVSTVLTYLKRKLDKMFEQDEDGSDEVSDSEIKRPEDIKKKNKDKMTFKDLGVRLESSEISKYSKLYDSLTIKFTEGNDSEQGASTYTLIIMIDLKEAIPEDKEKDFDPLEDIEKCYIKFKKYDIDTFEVIGQISKNVKIKNIDEDFLIDLKIEIDEKFSSGDDEFKIETE